MGSPKKRGAGSTSASAFDDACRAVVVAHCRSHPNCRVARKCPGPVQQFPALHLQCLAVVQPAEQRAHGGAVGQPAPHCRPRATGVGVVQQREHAALRHVPAPCYSCQGAGIHTCTRTHCSHVVGSSKPCPLNVSLSHCTCISAVTVVNICTFVSTAVIIAAGCYSNGHARGAAAMPMVMAAVNFIVTIQMTPKQHKHNHPHFPPALQRSTPPASLPPSSGPACRGRGGKSRRSAWG